MPNILFKLGGLDLSTYVRVNPDEHFDPAQGDHLEPSFSDSPFFEGQYFTSLHAKNKEMNIPLFLHPSQAPYLQDGLNQIVQGVNNALRPVTDLGQLLNAEWRNAQASNSTFWSVQFGRFEPAFVFRQTEKGWLAGNLHLWTLPYGHTATERIIGTYAAPANQSGLLIPAASMTAAAAGGTIVGDVSPQFDLRVRTGSYTGVDGQLGIIAALPIPSYNPIIPVGSFFGLYPSAIIYGASGAWASQFLAMDSSGGSQGAAVQGDPTSQSYFTFALSPASVYAGDNRVLGLVRARNEPFALRAFDQTGNPLGPTVVASALDGWSLVDYGVLNVPPWLGTTAITVRAYPGIPFTASGMFAQTRAAPAWTKEHGPIFVVPNAYTLMDLDWNSPLVSMDGFDGASGAVFSGNSQDMLGQAWNISSGASTSKYNGSSGLVSNSVLGQLAFIGTSVDLGNDFQIQAEFYLDQVTTQADMAVIAYNPNGNGINDTFFEGNFFSGPTPFIAINTPSSGVALVASKGLLPRVGAYDLTLVKRASMVTLTLGGPSGAFPGSASGGVLVATTFCPAVPTLSFFLGFQVANATTTIQSFRAKFLASTGHQSLDTFHLSQPLGQNTRMLTASGPDVVDLQARQRGPLQAINLPVPSLGAGLFVASFPWDQGAAGDLLSVDVRMRERFTYAR